MNLKEFNKNVKIENCLNFLSPCFYCWPLFAVIKIKSVQALSPCFFIPHWTNFSVGWRERLFIFCNIEMWMHKAISQGSAMFLEEEKKIGMTKAIEKVIKNRAYITNWSRQVETQKHFSLVDFFSFKNSSSRVFRLD